jgi:hypothetical protein
MMLALKRYQNLSIRTADCAAVAVGEINPARWKANVVENAREFGRWNLPANYCFNLIAKSGGSFDSRTGFGSDM